MLEPRSWVLDFESRVHSHRLGSRFELRRLGNRGSMDHGLGLRFELRGLGHYTKLILIIKFCANHNFLLDSVFYSALIYLVIIKCNLFGHFQTFHSLLTYEVSEYLHICIRWCSNKLNRNHSMLTSDMSNNQVISRVFSKCIISYHLQHDW